MAGPVRIAILANGSQAKSELDSVAGRAKTMGSRVQSLKAPALAVLGGIAVGAKTVADSASNLNEEVSKSQQIFGAQAGYIESFAGRADKALGQSKQQALDATSTFGLIAQKAGLGGQETAKFSTQFATLASDLASFNNTTPQEAIDAIGSAMRGESEPIRKYGVLLDDATLRNRALKLGLVDSVKTALTPQQKALAASREILAQTGKAQGDFARTSGGAANGSRIVAAQVENLKAKLGQGLQPAYQAVIGIVGKVVGFLAEHQTVAIALVGVLGALALAILAVNAAMLLSPAVLIVAGIVALGAALVVAYQKCEPFRQIVQQLGQIFVTNVLPILKQVGAFITGTLVPIFLRTAKSIGQSLKPVLAQLAQTFQTRILPAIKQVVAKFQEWWPTIQRVIVFVVKLYAGVLKFAAAVLGKVLPVVIQFAGFLISKIVPAVLGVIGVLVKIIGKVVSFAQAIGRGIAAVARFATSVARKIDDVIGFIADLPGKAVDALGDLGGLLVDAGKAILDGLIDGIKAGAEKVKDALSQVTDLIPDWKGPPKRDARLLYDNGRLIMGGLVKGLESQRGELRSRLRYITSNVVVQARKGSEGINQLLTTATKGLSDKAKKAFSSYTSSLKSLGVAQDKFNTKLEAARSNYSDLKNAAAEYAASARDAVVSYGSITSLGQGTGYGSLDELLSQRRARLGESSEFARVIEQLRKAGLNKGDLDDLVNAGVQGGLGAAKAIASGGAKAISEINGLATSLAYTGQRLGDSASKSLYGAGIEAADAFVSQLNRQQRQLDASARQMARVLLNALDTHAATNRGAGRSNVVQLKLSGPQISQLQRGREIKADLKAYEKAGGR